MRTTAVLSVVFLLAAATGLAVARASHRRDAPMATGLTVSALGIAGTSIDAVFELLVPSVAFHLAVESFSIVTSGLIVVGWAYFVAYFSDYEWVVKGRRIYLIAAPFFVIGGAFWIEGTHSLLAGGASTASLIVADRAAWYDAFDTYGYGITLLSLAALAVRAAERNQLYRRQAGILITAPIPPILVDQAGNVDVLPVAADLTPIGFAVTSLIMLYALYHRDLLEIVPIARETTINNIEDEVIAINNDDMVATVNDAATEMFDVTDDVLGSTLSDAFSEWPELVEAVERGEETTAALNDGRFVTVSLPPIRKRGVDIGTLVHLRDVTEKVEKQREIREKTERLERQNEHLDEFAGVVSHDIRNPLSIARGYTEEVARQVDDDAAVRKIRRSHERIETIVDDLLTLTRKGQQVDNAEAVSVEPVAEAAAQTAGVPDESLAFDGPETLWADPARLQELFENLFRNSVEHSSTSNRSSTDDTVEHGSTCDQNAARSDDTVEHGSTSGRTSSDDIDARAVGDADEPASDDGQVRGIASGDAERYDADADPDLDVAGYADAADGGTSGGYSPGRSNLADRTSRRANAADVTADDLTVRVGPLEDRDGFYVEDDGPGIPESERAKVLDRGYTNAQGGTGLGLSIVKSIAEAHDWELRIAESDAGGAQFEFLTDETDGDISAAGISAEGS
jgi:signal transduction histidine kinase